MLRRLARHRNAFWVLFFPLACLWAMVTRYRRMHRRNPYRSSLPVICVGNLHSGGSGKTPLVIALAEKLSDRRPAVLSRGYRARKEKSPVLVDIAESSGAERYGDEPWMISQRVPCPVWLSADRKAGLQAIEQAQTSQLVIMDDGFQHLKVAANLNLIVISVDRNLEDSYCLPLGELREPWSALADAHAVVLVRGEEPQNEVAWEAFLSRRFPQLPVFTALRRSDGIRCGEASLPSTARFGVFCGIASPQRFIDDLSSSLTEPVFSDTFEDHHHYRLSDIVHILAEKKRTGATHLVTTEKDHAKAERLFLAYGEPLWVARIRHELPEAFWYFLHEQLDNQ